MKLSATSIATSLAKHMRRGSTRYAHMPYPQDGAEIFHVTSEGRRFEVRVREVETIEEVNCALIAASRVEAA